MPNQNDNRTVPGFTVYHDLNSPTGESYHCHEYHEVIFFLSGEGRYVAVSYTHLVIMTAFGGVMSSWFIDGYHPEVIQQAHLYLFISALFYPALTMLFLYRNTLLGLGNGVTPMLAGVCELLSRMIGAPVLGHFFGFTGLCWINPIAWVTASGLLFLSYRKTMRNIRPVDPTVDA